MRAAASLCPIRICLNGVGGFPRRHAQVVLRSLPPAAVLASFDVDACCFVYDGERVLASARGLRALIERTNRVDPGGGPCHESRSSSRLRAFRSSCRRDSTSLVRWIRESTTTKGHHPRCLAAPGLEIMGEARGGGGVMKDADPVFGDGGEKLTVLLGY